MTSVLSRQSYLRASLEEMRIGLAIGVRPDPTLEEARAELAQALTNVTKSVLRDKYGPLVGVLSESAITEFLKNFESNLFRAKGDMTILFEETFDRLAPSIIKKKSNER